MKKIFNPFTYIRKIRELIGKIMKSVKRSVRIQLITAFTACALLGLFVSTKIVAPIFEDASRHAEINYKDGMEQINRKAQSTAEMMVDANKLDAVQSMIELENENLEQRQDAFKILVTDESGKVLYKTKQAQEEQINLHNTIRNATSFAINYSNNNDIERSRKEFITFSPITIEGKNLYMFVSGIPQGEVVYYKVEGPFPFLIGVLVFIFSFFYITKRKMKQIEAMAQGVKEIEKGNLAYRIEKKGEDEIASLTENINNMAEELMNNIEKERKLEKQKNELITNVSHDLRTPLTSIMGYLRLLRDSKYENKEQHDEYTRIAFTKSEQLKNLIEDLFEYTKLTNEQVVLEKQEVCINELLEQLIEELVPQAEEHGLAFVKKFPEERAYATVDSEKMVRVFDNLLMNAIKYSKDDGEIKVSLQRQRKDIQIVIANHSEEFTREELGNLFERFYKKDQSRSRVTEGSGLGLAIAKSIVELQGGSIRAEYEDGIIQFIVALPIIEK
ncbi:HAMP domain-containing sensor histidine kinase [Bacillus toyonensis]|uniref:histidine kinase n=1 Tax=Bacillus toyonensis TaxID=155322 RepID=A0AAP8JUT3_9BACI|nr:HAMP domain-containing sensor histidine kinase [Bacillus toyonensis]PEB90224.1 two-component sensor histidine kinase [Bacillus toyonensis]PHE05264.1 two-component sensor histidine kinase [Bacillus toyonensis]PHG30719.1 two-component sensor histidine kinase [Bacillus toyonensis]